MQPNDFKLIAETIQKQYHTHGSSNLTPFLQINRAVEELALDLATTFAEREDARDFDRHAFLTWCSRDTDTANLNEVWENDRAS